MKRFAFALLALLAAGCGLREPLTPPPGGSLPVAPMAAREPPGADLLLTTPPIARPVRVDELIRRSEPREDDRFDLPPPDVPEGAIPVPANGTPPVAQPPQEPGPE
jgi:hypothetical protein